MDDVIEVRTLTLDASQRLVDAAVAHAAHLALRVCVAVAGHSGDLLAFARMDGAPAMSPTIAQDKAYSVAAFGGMPTHAWWDLLEGEPALLHGIVKTERLVIFAGGLPVTVDGALVGAVGVSGGTAAQDREIAEHAAAMLGP